MKGKTYEDKINYYIYDRIETALRGRSWNWLRKQAGISQSSIQTQKKSDAARAEGVAPRFNLETVLAVAKVLERPVTYFLPASETGHTDDAVAVQAMRRITEIVDWARGEGATPDAIEESLDLAKDAVGALDLPARRAARARKQRAAPKKGSRRSAGKTEGGSGSRPKDQPLPGSGPQ